MPTLSLATNELIGMVSDEETLGMENEPTVGKLSWCSAASASGNQPDPQICA